MFSCSWRGRIRSPSGAAALRWKKRWKRRLLCRLRPPDYRHKRAITLEGYTPESSGNTGEEPLFPSRFEHNSCLTGSTGLPDLGAAVAEVDDEPAPLDLIPKV